MMKRNSRFQRKLRPVALNCGFCSGHIEPSYKEVGGLMKFVTERGKINPRSRTGICSTHQRRVTEEIKKARFIALLPFVVRA